jgi:hypothetical protein
VDAGLHLFTTLLEALVGKSVTFGVTNAEVAFGVKSVTLKVANGVSTGLLAMVVIAVTIGVSIGEKNRTRVKIIKKLTMKRNVVYLAVLYNTSL